MNKPYLHKAHTKFEKLFYLSWNHAQITDEISGVLMLLDIVLMPINYPVLLLTNWRIRLL